MVAAQQFRAGGAAFAERRAAELAAADDQRVVEQAALLQILDQGRDRLVHRRAFLRQTILDVRFALGAVEIPAPIEELHEPHSLLGQPPGEQAVVGKTGPPGVAPYASSVSADSREMSITSGTAVCIRNANSYWAMRVSVSGWPSSRACIAFRSPSASSVSPAHLAGHARRIRGV